jgi:DNA-binding transcriptional LysR family regulator
MINLRQLEYFVMLADELHFGRAAERLGIAQPALTQQMQRLEADIGVSLIDRSQRRIQLTTAGTMLRDEGRRLLRHAERTVALTQRAGRGEVGRLVLGVAESASYAILPELLREYRRRYPDVDLVVRLMNTATQVVAIHDGEIDAGLARTPLDAQGLATRALTVDTVAILLPEEHRLAKRKAIALPDLAGESLIVYPTAPRTSWVDFMLSVFRDAGVDVKPVEEASDTFTAMALVAAGLGVMLVPGNYGLFERPGLVWRPLAEPAPRTSLVLLHSLERPLPTVKGLLEVVDRLWPKPVGGRKGKPPRGSATPPVAPPSARP